MTPMEDNHREGPLERIRITEWARREGISRSTAYRMLRRGILPLLSERSATGRWYVYVPTTPRGRTVLYARAAPGPDQVASLDRQTASLSRWAQRHSRTNFAVVREIANPLTDILRKLEAVVADPNVTEIVIDHPGVVGEAQSRLLLAALASQGRALSVMSGTRLNSRDRKADLQSGIARLCVYLHGRERGLEAARFAISPHGREAAHETDAGTGPTVPGGR